MDRVKVELQNYSHRRYFNCVRKVLPGMTLLKYDKKNVTQIQVSLKLIKVIKSKVTLRNRLNLNTTL